MSSLTENEQDMIRNTFKGNEPLLIALRKIMLPELEANAPIGDQIDMWANVQVDGIPAEEAITNIKARVMLMTHLEGGLMKLKALAEAKKLTKEEMEELNKKNSTK